MKNKILIPLLAVVIVLCCAVGGTIAWLIDTADPVVNTFTVGNIGLSLKETTSDYKMIPGNPIAKDPKITVNEKSESCWVFVKVVKSGNYSDYLEDCLMTDKWGKLESASNDLTAVYYCEVSADETAAADVELQVLKGGETERTTGEVSVKSTVTKQMMDDIQSGAGDEPTLTFTAYAVQKDGFNTAEAAWAEAAKIQ